MARRSIIIKPIVSEKSEVLASNGTQNQYAFVVDRKANKIEIKAAIEEKFGTTVVAVNTTIMPAKPKSRNTRGGVISGNVSAYKKAYVTLATGEELDFYGGENY